MTHEMPKKSNNRPTETDIYVGDRIRERRIMMGMSQQDIADLIGVTYQQAHKYERGKNRISASRLYDIAHVLQVPVSYFFEEMGHGANNNVKIAPAQRMCLELARNFMSIQDKSQQEALSQMARVLAEDPQLRSA
jgi:transcriptional regulator with XRE-family HTH domain|tara:strand:+ start:6360 stop:6764 length:405 start_codon:yes stop_codon:yes gene_type:complete